MMWIARTGAQWRHLPERYGKWNSVFRRYRRQATTGAFEFMLETLADAVERDGRVDMIDSTVVPLRSLHTAPARIGRRSHLSGGRTRLFKSHGALTREFIGAGTVRHQSS